MKLNFSWLCVVVMAAGVAACVQVGTGMYRPDINDDVVNRVTQGQSESEVTALLGMPYGRVRFEKLKSTSLDYRYRDTWGYWVDFSVMMGDDGKVVDKVSRRIDPPGRD